MEGSDEFGWDKSANSRGLNAFLASSASLENRLVVSRDASDNTGWVVAAKANDLVISCTENYDNQIGSSGVCGNELDPEICGVVAEDISLREWLDQPERSVDLFECLHIFRQIVETVNLAHSQGMVVHNVRPSCFIMSSFNRISFIESASSSSSDSDSFMDRKMSKVGKDQVRQRSEVETEESTREISSSARSTSTNWTRLSSIEKAGERRDKKSGEMEVAEGTKNFPPKQILMMETNWYTSPEEAAGAPSSFPSDIYRLGVLLFEVFCTFSSLEEKLRTMSNLRHRVVPPQLLLKWPKEASFCLWLLHPQPSTRPKMSEVLLSEFLNEPRDDLDEREDAINLKEEIEEHELLLEFLLQLQQKRQQTARKLHDITCYLSADIEEVLKQQSVLTKQGSFYAELDKDEGSEIGKVDQISGYPLELEELSTLSPRKHFRQGFQIQKEDKLTGNLTESHNSASRSENQEKFLAKTTQLMKNFKKIESAYFSTRCRLVSPIRRLPNRSSSVNSMGRGSTARTDGSSVDNWASTVPHSEEKHRWINPFLEGLCKYLSFSKLKVRADLKQGDLLNSSNLVCSLSFDRDKEFFATAGVNRKIKVFECDTILNNDRDIHYPVIEMASRSKFSCICWNSYIKSQIASSDFEGIVQVWDVTRGQVFVEMREHERRVWTVDFSLADPTKLASGSDDGTVKLWNINQGGSIGTIRTKANICSVQFSPDSARSLAVGSADHKIYCYDLRNTRIPWCTLIGHSKTVSYVKFVDSLTLVSASTDNSLKLWDLAMNTSRVLDNPIQTFTGHTNVKNFVGLSISDGYIATGSETNEVFVYHKAFSMPVLSFKLNNTDPLSGQEIDDTSQFVSCVSWRGYSTTLVAANSTGNIKLLEMDHIEEIFRRLQGSDLQSKLSCTQEEERGA